MNRHGNIMKGECAHKRVSLRLIVEPRPKIIQEVLKEMRLGNIINFFSRICVDDIDSNCSDVSPLLLIAKKVFGNELLKITHITNSEFSLVFSQRFCVFQSVAIISDFNN